MEREQKYKVLRVFAWIVIIINILFFGLPKLAAQNATDILDKAASLYNSSNGITATFTIRTHSEIQNTAESFEGTINLKGDKFTLVTPDMITWFDGTTQWAYMPVIGEVNVSTPTSDELQLINPAILLGNYKKGFTAKYKGESTASNAKAAYDIELTPKKKGDIIKVELQVVKYSGMPARIVVEYKNKLSNTIHISNLKTGIDQPDSFFQFDESTYPDAEIIDLR